MMRKLAKICSAFLFLLILFLTVGTSGMRQQDSDDVVLPEASMSELDKMPEKHRLVINALGTLTGECDHGIAQQSKALLKGQPAYLS